MNKSVDITIILDRSGSMSTIKDDMEGGLNTFIEDQKKLAGKCTVSLYQFDDKYDAVFEGQPVVTVPKIKLEPRGNTALNDALGKTIKALGIRLKDMPEAERPEKVIVVVVTDGQENASKEFQKSHIKEMIDHQQGVYKWEFVFLGANQDAIQESSNYGVQAQNAMTFSASSAGVHAAYASMSRNLGDVRTGASLSTAFTAEDRKKQADLLKKTPDVTLSNGAK